MLITLLVMVIVLGILYYIVTLLPLPQPFKNIAICILLLVGEMTDILPFPKPRDAEGRVKLSDADYRRLRSQVYSEQGKTCKHCSKRLWTLADMHLHHKRLRKMGGGSRDDSRANVEGICQDCHRKEHNQ